MLRKNDIAELIAGEFSMKKSEANKVLDFVIWSIKLELIKWNDVIIPTLFTLSVKNAIGRTVIVPSTWEVSDAKIYKKLRCKFSTKFKNQVKNI